jgi:hypothetical protein
MRAYYVVVFVALASCLASSLGGSGGSCAAPSATDGGGLQLVVACTQYVGGFCGVCSCHAPPLLFNTCGEGAECCIEDPDASCPEEAGPDASDVIMSDASAASDALDALDAAVSEAADAAVSDASGDAPDAVDVQQE